MTENTRAPEAGLADTGGARERLAAVRTEVGKAVVGQDAAVSGLLVALLCGGHVLMEGVPGTAKTLLVRTYSASLAQYRDQQIQYRPLQSANRDTEVVVKSFLRRSGAEPLSIDYAMHDSLAGWKVFDVTVAGVSLVLNYRETFAAEVRRGGIDGLIKALSEKNRQNEAISSSSVL